MNRGFKDQFMFENPEKVEYKMRKVFLNRRF